jgi:sulfate/thiosulfate transport system ATP-binding protein
MTICVESVTKQFGNFLAVDNVSFNVEKGSLVALLGPSGSGKSTLLRMIAGLEKPDTGNIWITGENTTDRPVQDRGIGFVFQHYALFKHMTIRQNIAFGLEIRKIPKTRIRERVEELLDLVQLRGLGDRYPAQLSGGQRQRIALARALAVQPQVLLLDEPFGALDAKVRKELRSWIRQLHDEVHLTSVFVTHDQEEAMEVADTVVVMNEGRIEQTGSPADVYDHPKTPFVMSFLGPVNVLSPNTVMGSNSHAGPVFLRPHDVLIQHSPNSTARPAQIRYITNLGWEIHVELVLQTGEALSAYLSRRDFDELDIKPGQQVYVKPKQLKSFTQAPTPQLV